MHLSIAVLAATPGIVRPVLAAITAYGVGLFIHILAVVLAFGPTFGYGFFIGFADTKAPAAVPAVHRAANMANLFLVTPGMVVLVAAGIYLMAKGDWGNQSWITVGFIAIILMFGLVHAFFLPQGRKAVDIAERNLAAGGELSAEYRAVSARIARVGQLAGLIVVVATFFMVVKP
jgi:uncharacterized membrane protein